MNEYSFFLEEGVREKEKLERKREREREEEEMNEFLSLKDRLRGRVEKVLRWRHRNKKMCAILLQTNYGSPTM